MSTNKEQEASTAIRVKTDALKQRVDRCSYLKERYDKMIACGNREQADAYAQRINWHKPKILETLEDIEKLEESLQDDNIGGNA